MITQRIDELSYADIEDLVQRQVPEGRVLDYKRDLPDRTGDKTKEFLADVASFANAGGGHLVFGVTGKKEEGKNTNLPDKLSGVGDINIEQEVLRLESVIRDGIQPRIVGLRVKPLVESGKPTVVVIHIPRSWNAPHMIAKGSSKFYSRTSAGKQPLDVTEIRHAFAMSESVGERIKAFRDERIGRILAGETPVPITSGATVVVHSIPIDAFITSETIDLASLDEASKGLCLLGSRFHSKRYNFDGVLKHSQAAGANSALGALQIFRSGATEIIDAGIIEPFKLNDFPYLFFDLTAVENHLITHCDQVRATFQKLGLGVPFLIFVSLLNVRGLGTQSLNQYNRTLCPIDRNHLLIPDVLVDDLSISAAVFLRPVFDLLWQACGSKGCPYYDANGRRAH